MTDRERLIEIVKNSLSAYGKEARVDCKPQDFIADYLLENGVIVPPCKVGDTVYCVRRWPSGRKTIHKFEAPDWDWIMEHHNDFGKTVFLTLEEAEKALKERETE